MRIEPKALVSLGALALALPSAGCTATGELPGWELDHGWGEANRATMAAQVIDPNPEYENPIPETSADHAVDAIDRYREGNVKQPERVSTTEISQGPD